MTAADAFLLDALADGPRAATDLISEARDAGLSERQLRRARERVCAPPEQAGRRWHWRLTETAALKVVTPQGRDGEQRQAPPSSHVPPLETVPLMEGDIDWQHVGAQVPPPPRVKVMEPDNVMETPVAAAAPKSQAPPGDHDVCQACVPLDMPGLPARDPGAPSARPEGRQGRRAARMPGSRCARDRLGA